MTGARSAHIATVLGTRPDAVKLSPVIRALRDDAGLEPVVISTAQHREILDPVLDLFGIRPDHDLSLMRPDQSLEGFASRALRSLTGVVRDEDVDVVVVQGDTTTALAGALAAFYARTPAAHVEAGLRTADRWMPYPEEMNRRLVSRLAELHFAPTRRNRDDLVAEGVDPWRIHVTGNPVIDALHTATERSGESLVSTVLPGFDPSTQRLLLVTLHRRESFGQPLAAMCDALREVVDAHPDVVMAYPVHPNPSVHEVVEPRLADHPRVELLEPLGYVEFVSLMGASYLILTDSGGVQEEAPSLGVPVLVVRDVTERPEAVEAGSARLVGRDPETVVGAAEELLAGGRAYWEMARNGTSPYGDGRAASRIVRAIRGFLDRRGD